MIINYTYKCHDKYILYLVIYFYFLSYTEISRRSQFFLFCFKIVLCFLHKVYRKMHDFTVNANLFIYYNSMWIRELSLLFLPSSYESSHTSSLQNIHNHTVSFPVRSDMHCRKVMDKSKRSKSRRSNSAIEIIDY